MPDIARAVREGLVAWDRDDLDRLASLRGAEAASETSTTTAAEYGSAHPGDHPGRQPAQAPALLTAKGFQRRPRPRRSYSCEFRCEGLTGRLPRVSSHT